MQFTLKLKITLNYTHVTHPHALHSGTVAFLNLSFHSVVVTNRSSFIHDITSGD